MMVVGATLGATRANGTEEARTPVNSGQGSGRGHELIRAVRLSTRVSTDQNAEA
jgi:hypothetical protein